MNAPTRLGLYGAGLGVAFVAAFGLSGALVPPSAVTAWADRAHSQPHGGGDDMGMGATAHGGDELKGQSLSAHGYVLSPIAAPRTPGEPGRLSFRVETTAGAPVTTFATAHDKQLHLVVVRSDGTGYRHVHPTLDTATGTWSIPWTWSAAGTYRAYADFATTGSSAQSATLTRAVEVAGSYVPVASTPSRTDTVDGFDVAVAGDLVAGASSPLTVSVTRDGKPVTTLQPYLGAFGHLVALREGDLTYLHVHAEGTAPRAGDVAGPDIAFAAEAPTAGRYLRYLDVQVDGPVHTARFVRDAAPGAHAGTPGSNSSTDTHSGH